MSDYTFYLSDFTAEEYRAWLRQWPWYNPFRPETDDDIDVKSDREAAPLRRASRRPTRGRLSDAKL